MIKLPVMFVVDCSVMFITDCLRKINIRVLSCSVELLRTVNHIREF